MNDFAITVQIDDAPYTFRLISTGAALNEHKTHWGGSLTFALFQPLPPVRALVKVLRLMTRAGWDGLLVGELAIYPVLTAWSVQTVFSPDEEAQTPGAHARIQISYRTVQEDAPGVMEQIEGGAWALTRA